MHGAGNDFVLLDLRDQDFVMHAEIAIRLADRRTGIGCDQFIVLKATSETDCLLEYEVWNVDGRKSQQCGNGVRCIGLYLRSTGEAREAEFCIQGPVSKISLQDRGNGQFRVNMGRPRFDAEKVPITLSSHQNSYELDIAGQAMKLGAVSMGNPHALLEVSAINKVDVESLGAQIGTHVVFPEGCNVGFAQVIDRKNIRLRVFERGVGETRACGSGACAAVVILRNIGKLDEEVLVNQTGGTLIIEWTGRNEPVMMTGPAVHLFTGMLT